MTYRRSAPTMPVDSPDPAAAVHAAHPNPLLDGDWFGEEPVGNAESLRVAVGSG